MIWWCSATVQTLGYMLSDILVGLTVDPRPDQIDGSYLGRTNAQLANK